MATLKISQGPRSSRTQEQQLSYGSDGSETLSIHSAQSVPSRYFYLDFIEERLATKCIKYYKIDNKNLEIHVVCRMAIQISDKCTTDRE